MSHDASLPPNAPVIPNGEVDASHHPHSTLDDRPRLRDVCRDIHVRVQRFLDVEGGGEVLERTQKQVRVGLDVIGKAVREYGFEHLSLSYNGGKDCLVLLILYLSVLHTHFTAPHGRRKDDDDDDGDGGDGDNDAALFPTSIPSIYAKPPDPFPAVTDFVESSSRRYRLALTHISTNPGGPPPITQHPTQKAHSSPPAPTTSPSQTGSKSTTSTSSSRTDDAPIITFRDAFATYLASNPQISAIFVGTRRTDPHGGHLTHFDMTDGNWPRFVRVHPVIDWHLDEIWCFLRHGALGEDGSGSGRGLEYCSMYDEGYTSLGGVGDTVKNPRLRVLGGEGEGVRYRPAFEMVEDGAERAGRE